MSIFSVRSNWNRAHEQNGFTIVELLIVIVVIGILAAITIVAYNGVSGRANDTAVQVDFHDLSQLMRKYQIENGHLPTNTTELLALNFKASKSAYDLTSTLSRNIGVCIVASPGNERYAFLSLSKSGSWFTYDTSGKVTQSNKSSWPGNASPCTSSMGFSASETGYWATFGAETGAPNNGWYSWVAG